MIFVWSLLTQRVGDSVTTRVRRWIPSGALECMDVRMYIGMVDTLDPPHGMYYMCALECFNMIPCALPPGLHCDGSVLLPVVGEFVRLGQGSV